MYDPKYTWSNFWQDLDHLNLSSPCLVKHEISLPLRNYYKLISETSMDSQLSVAEKTERFFKIIEAGDIELFNTFEEGALAVFGFTKVGKTTSCHILCGSCVRSE